MNAFFQENTMKKSLGSIVMISLLLVACSEPVPQVDDPHHPVDAKGNPIDGMEFMKKYCSGKATDETCAKVSQAISMDSIKGGQKQ